MKSTGIVRKLDNLGRIVIPSELRRTLDIGDQDPLEIYMDNERIILKKYVPPSVCIFCGSADETTNYNGKNVCKECLVMIKSQK